MLQTTKALGENLQWVEAEIRDLEQKSEGSKGKAQAHYQERLKELCHTQETLEEELMGLGTEEIPQSPNTIDTVSTESPGTGSYSHPSKPEMSSASPQGVWKSFLTGKAMTGEWYQNPTPKQGVGRRETFGWTMYPRCQAYFRQDNLLGSFLPKAQWIEQTKWKGAQTVKVSA